MALPESVRAAVVDEPGHITIQEFDMPEVGTDGLLLEVEMTGVCGTDPKIYEHKRADVTLPVIPGHEMVGRVAKIGDDAREMYHVDVDDRIVARPQIACGQCEECFTNGPIFCEHGRNYGITVPSTEPPHLWGSYSEYMYIAPVSSVIKISDSVTPEAAILGPAVLGNSIRWTQEGADLFANPIVIQGPGPQGLGAVIAAKEAGASPIIITGVNGDEARLEMAEQLGADLTINVSELDGPLENEVRDVLDGKLSPRVLDTTGHPAGMQNSLDVVGREGTVVMIGQGGAGVETPVEFDSLISRDVTIENFRSHRIPHARQAMRFIEETDYPLEDLVTHVFDLDDAEKAIKTVMGEEDVDEPPIKVVIEP
ncbi:zinc-dependent alcohol dehydrogenase [Salinigranum rubrum]|nr:alcohol dehydrogenase catalytic domain-containing protein [Salinigranum rubrum]